MKWLKLSVPGVLLAAYACSGGGFSSDSAGGSGSAGLADSGKAGSSPSGGGGRGGTPSSVNGGSSSPAEAGSASSSDAGDSSLTEGGDSSSGTAGSSSSGTGGSSSSGTGGSSSSGAGGSSSGAGGTSTATGGSAGSSGGGNCAAGATTPCVRQAQEWAAGDDNLKKQPLPFKQAVLAGSTVVVFAADMNINRATPDSPVGTGTPDPILVTDSTNGVYDELLTVLDERDWDDTKVFVRSNVPAGALTIQTTWETNQWHAMMIVEVANVPAKPSVAVAGILNAGADETKDAATSGPLTLKASPALVLGLGINFTDKNGDEGAPYAGTGFTAVLAGWNWKGKEGTTQFNSALLESAYFPNPGKVAATFTPSKTINYHDNIMVIAVGLQ